VIRDYYLPGCAPPPKLIWGAIEAILTGALPPKGAVLSPNKACCDDCPRKDSKPDKIEIAGSTYHNVDSGSGASSRKASSAWVPYAVGLRRR
jgi:coenzyme F420-reducing hydrogenase gamma subunit